MLQTFGGTGGDSRVRHDKYQRFGDDHELGLVVNIEAKKHVVRGRDASTWVDDSNSDNADGSRGDGSSEKAIIQAHTTTITYSDRV